MPVDPRLICHGEYKDDELVSLMEKHQIDVICHFSLSEETYCYALSRSLQCQLPIFYIRRGALSERLDGVHELYQGFHFGLDMMPALFHLLQKLCVVPDQPRSTMPVSNEIVRTTWYDTNYKSLT